MELSLGLGRNDKMNVDVPRLPPLGNRRAPTSRTTSLSDKLVKLELPEGQLASLNHAMQSRMWDQRLHSTAGDPHSINVLCADVLMVLTARLAQTDLKGSFIAPLIGSRRS
jgi:hypothetical protein